MTDHFSRQHKQASDTWGMVWIFVVCLVAFGAAFYTMTREDYPQRLVENWNDFTMRSES